MFCSLKTFPEISLQEGLAEVVRSLVGGIELLVSLLESESESVLSAVCAAIAKIARDPQNLAIMTDYGAVTSLSRLAVRVSIVRFTPYYFICILYV